MGFSLSCFPFVLVSLAYLRLTIAGDETDLTRLRKDLLRNYDNNTRPVQSHENVTVVKISVRLRGLEFLEKTGFVVLFVKNLMVWNDEHMHWDPKMYGGIKEIPFSPTELWRPDIRVMNSFDLGEFTHIQNPGLIRVDTEWSTVWDPKSNLAVACNADYYRWPYDQHECIVKLASWAHDGSEIRLTSLKYPFPGEYEENREWNLKSFNQSGNLFTFKCCPNDPFSDAELRVIIQRRSSNHVAAVITVAIGISVATLVSFWLNPFAQERIPVLLVAMLLNSVYLNYVYDKVPPNGNRVPWIIAYFRDSLIMVEVAIAWTIGLRYLVKSKSTSQTVAPLPPWIITGGGMFQGVLGILLCLDPHPNERNASSEGSQGMSLASSGDEQELVSQENTRSTFQETEWTWFANLLDRVIFLLYLLIYSAFTLSI